MNALKEQIAKACERIAENQRKVYDKGVEDGKASVKHIKFTIETGWEYFQGCAFKGMTWREYVDSNFNSAGELYIENNSVFIWSDKIDAKPDDVIVPDGYYVTLPPPEDWKLIYNRRYQLQRTPGASALDFVNSEYNTLELFIDSEGYLRTPTGEYVYPATNGDEDYYVNPEYDATWQEGESFEYNDNFIAEEKFADSYVTIEGVDYRISHGMTWQEFIDSNFSDAMKYDLDSGEIYHAYGSWSGVYLDGEKVKITDELVSDAYYDVGWE